MGISTMRPPAMAPPPAAVPAAPAGRTLPGNTAGAPQRGTTGKAAAGYGSHGFANSMSGMGNAFGVQAMTNLGRNMRQGVFPQGRGAGAAPAGEGKSDVDKMYEDLLSQDDASWKQKQGVLQDQMGLFQRQAMNLNARLGGTIAGGYASLSGQALGKGMDAFNKGAMEHDDRRRQLMLAWMDKKIQERHRQEERGWQLDDQAANQAHELELERIRNLGTVPTNPSGATGASASGGNDLFTAAANNRTVQNSVGQRGPGQFLLDLFG